MWFIFYGGELLAPRPTPKLEGHLLSAVRDSLFDIFAAALHVWRPSPPSATWRRAVPWWQGTHLTWFIYTTGKIIVLCTCFIYLFLRHTESQWFVPHRLLYIHYTVIEQRAFSILPSFFSLSFSFFSSGLFFLSSGLIIPDWYDPSQQIPGNIKRNTHLQNTINIRADFIFHCISLL
jgi:hypothetical protein